MGYVEKIIEENETVLYHGRIHWIIYVPGLVLLVLGCVAWVLVADQILRYVAIAIIVLGLLNIFVKWLQRISVEIAVTNRRIIYKRGWISRRTIEMNMEKVESVDVIQSIPGRIFNFGTIIVRGTGAGIEPMRTIAHPLEFRNSMIAK